MIVYARASGKQCVGESGDACTHLSVYIHYARPPQRAVGNVYSIVCLVYSTSPHVTPPPPPPPALPPPPPGARLIGPGLRLIYGGHEMLLVCNANALL